MSKSGLCLVVLVFLLGAPGSHAGSNGIFLGKKAPVASAAAESAAQSIASAAGAGLSSSMTGSMMASMSLGPVASAATSQPMFSFPTYPAVNDYSSGQCAGYAFCFSTWNPPVVTEPDVMCPAGYELTNSQGAPICVQKSMNACPAGFDLSGKGDCCTVRSSGQCYANWDSCSGGAASAGSYMYSGDVGVGSICKGTSDYSAVVDGVQLVQVTSGSKWFDGSSSSSSNSAGSRPGYGYGSSGSSSAAGDDDDNDTTNVQIIPSGQLVNLNGKLVHVGPIPAGVPLAGGSSSSSSSSGGGSSSGSSSTDASGLTPAQQAALDALQRQAQQQGTYIPDQTAAGNGGSSSSSSSSADPSLPPPTMSGQQAALDVLQQQAQQQGTYIPGQDGSNSGQSAGSNPVNSFDLPPMTQPVTAGAAGSGAAARFAGKPPKEGLLLTTVLLMLPKILLKAGPKMPSMSISFDVPKVVADQLVGSKEVVASLANTKEDFLPKCFSKCCAPDAGVVCVPASTSVNYAKPAYICPPGCSFLDNSNKCLRSTGHFTPCLPTDTVCSWGEQPICVGSKSFFGIDACKFVGALQQHLPKVQCPYKSLARGLQYQQLG